MTFPGHVHWHEGLFLQQHHLQSMQRASGERLSMERRFSFPYPYGLVESRLAADAMENMVLEFDLLRAVMPSGTVVDFPTGADIPTLEFKDRFESSSKAMTILLGVPVWSPRGANTVREDRGGAREKRLFRVREVEIYDENTGENPQPVLARRVNARLMFEDEDRTDMETLPILRIVHASGGDSALPRLDSSFIPPCMLVTGSPTLRELVRDLSNAVEASRREQVVLLTRGGFSVERLGGQEFRQMLRLRALNRFAGTLPSLVAAPAVSPFEMYLRFRDLIGELAGVDPANDPFEIAPYDHDAPAVAFMEIADRLRGLLEVSGGERFLKLPLAQDGGVFWGTITDEQVERGAEMFLAIKTNEDPRVLAELVEDEDRFKLIAKSKATLRLRGLKLVQERNPPMELPAQSGLHYFRVMKAESRRQWDSLVEEREIAAAWPGAESSEDGLAVYWTLAD